MRIGHLLTGHLLTGHSLTRHSLTGHQVLDRAASRRAALAVVGACFLLFYGCSDDDPDIGGSTVLLPGVGVGVGDTDNLRQQVSLDDRYIGELRIEGDSWKATGPRQEISLTFAASGLASVRQVELLLEPSPDSAFDLSTAVFEPVAPLVTLPPGAEIAGNNQLRIGAATLTVDLAGNRILGTLTLKTSSSFNAFVRAHITVRLLSVGPGVSQRDTYEAGELNLGVIVN